jgi:hypothetical protein
MAETYSTQYNLLRVVSPRGKVAREAVLVRPKKADYTQVLVGTAADTVVLQVLPPQSALDMVLSWIYFTGFTAGMTLSLGWRAYKKTDGTIATASATGLYNVADVSNGTGILTGGMQAVATPDDNLPEVRFKDFDNAEDVILFATFGTQAPGANAVLECMFYYQNMG